MKLRKSIAILLTLALSLGAAPTAGAGGAVEGQSTTFQSAGTVTQEMSLASDSNRLENIKAETIDVRITNIYTILVNPYGMTIKLPDNTDTSDGSIVSVPMYIENHTDQTVDVTATATVIPQGDIVLDSEPTRQKVDDDSDHADPSEALDKKRVYLYMRMTEEIKGGTPIWSEEKQTVISKEGSSDSLTVPIMASKDAALQICGDTSIPPYGTWYRKDKFEVKIVLSFTPKQDYTVSFDAMDYWWDEEDEDSGLEFDVEFLVDGKSYKLPKDYHSSGAPRANMVINATQDLTFTIKTAEEAKGTCYAIREVTLILNGDEVQKKPLYLWEHNANDPMEKIVQFSYTIDATKVYKGDKLDICVVLNKVTIK